jgi:hypothetical protein
MGYDPPDSAEAVGRDHACVMLDSSIGDDYVTYFEGGVETSGGRRSSSSGRAGVVPRQERTAPQRSSAHGASALSCGERKRGVMVTSPSQPANS